MQKIILGIYNMLKAAINKVIREYVSGLLAFDIEEEAIINRTIIKRLIAQKINFKEMLIFFDLILLREFFKYL